ncbi:FtsX-like permease family protein [Moritella sp. Urea-trap-13]|uniref:ABC transporter permease n=1 Tax=Moritella sp. Urea-trap-13 TaxID=2058327 RepID=UPI000C33E52F|nr:FtsX-like permease family protein [Moritella sp. Urea-trap-13]PKH08103.1 ABC transporter permease [Moritella sp. Urea-trap-13]
MILTFAWRNLWRHKTRTWLTISAMVFSNVLLVFMFSLQSGTYNMMINNSLDVFSGHLQLQDRRYLDQPKQRYDINHVSQLAMQIRQALSSDAVSIRGSAFSLLSSESRSFGAQVIGVQPAFDQYTSTISGVVKQGRYLTSSDTDAIILGRILAKNLKLTVGDTVTLLGSDREGSIAAGVVTVVGIFSSGMPALDRNIAQISLPYFQSLFYSENRANYIVIKTADPLALSHAKNIIAPLLDAIATKDPQQQLVLRDWDALQPGIKQAIQADIGGAIFMYFILILLVSFSVMNTQLMSVLERTREFGTMMALGLRPSNISRLIMLETSVMALIGLVLGVAIGMAITVYLYFNGLTYEGMEEMTEKFNMADRIYPQISLFGAFAGPLVVMLFSCFATLYPVWKIRRLTALNAMRAV